MTIMIISLGMRSSETSELDGTVDFNTMLVRESRHHHLNEPELLSRSINQADSIEFFASPSCCCARCLSAAAGQFASLPACPPVYLPARLPVHPPSELGSRKMSRRVVQYARRISSWLPVPAVGQLPAFRPTDNSHRDQTIKDLMPPLRAGDSHPHLRQTDISSFFLCLCLCLSAHE